MQADVAKQLRQVFPRMQFEEEYQDPESGYSVDIRAERGGGGGASDGASGASRVWAVEVDGPERFLKVSNPPIVFYLRTARLIFV